MPYSSFWAILKVSRVSTKSALLPRSGLPTLSIGLADTFAEIKADSRLDEQCSIYRDVTSTISKLFRDQARRSQSELVWAAVKLHEKDERLQAWEGKFAS